MQLLTAISTIDDLNYPEKTVTYYIVNVPYIFSACWKVSSVSPTTIQRRRSRFQTIEYEQSFKYLQVVKPLLQERTKLKVHVLQGCGRDELLKVNWFCVFLFCYPYNKMGFIRLQFLSKCPNRLLNRTSVCKTT